MANSEDRARYINLEILRTLNDPGLRGLLFPESNLRDQVRVDVFPAPTEAELTEALRYLDREHLIAGVPATGLAKAKWKITDKGRLALTEC